LSNLLIHQGTSPENAAIIVDSILDWKDADDLHRLSGAENDYYKTLSKPYQAADKDFETPEQLILVRGVTSGILYGNGQMKGIMPYLTAYGKTNRININTAPQEILAALPGMDAGALERIIEFRASSVVPTESVLRELLGAAYSQMASYIGFVSNERGVFSIEATGYTETLKKGYSILATVVFDSPSQYRYVYYKSPVEVIR
jgi:general secretion pathway protein K